MCSARRHSCRHQHERLLELASGGVGGSAGVERQSCMISDARVDFHGIAMNRWWWACSAPGADQAETGYDVNARRHQGRPPTPRFTQRARNRRTLQRQRGHPRRPTGMARQRLTTHPKTKNGISPGMARLACGIFPEASPSNHAHRCALASRCQSAHSWLLKMRVTSVPAERPRRPKGPSDCMSCWRKRLEPRSTLAFEPAAVGSSRPVELTSNRVREVGATGCQGRGGGLLRGEPR
jgi:hypothetical protein